MEKTNDLRADSKITNGSLQMRDPSSCLFDELSLGEVMLRFDPGENRIARSRNFQVWEGGGEYNVARGLRKCFGLRTSILTALVDNPVGRLIEDLILQGGVDTSLIRWELFDGVGQQARNGMYFLERGFGVRGGIGMMDRAHAAISQVNPETVDLHGIFSRGVRWFHTGGIMAALSERSTDLVRESMIAAKRFGTVVSYDCNYRPSLWKRRNGRHGSVAMNRSLMPYVDVLFGHEGDIAEPLGEVANGPAWHTLESFAEMAERISSEFSNLRVIASTMRKPLTANQNCWSGFVYTNGEAFAGPQFDRLDILDRVGAGDSFAAGIIYGLLSDRGPQWALNCGVAHGALAMTTPGDASMATLDEVERLMTGGHANTLR